MSGLLLADILRAGSLLVFGLMTGNGPAGPDDEYGLGLATRERLGALVEGYVNRVIGSACQAVVKGNP